MASEKFEQARRDPEAFMCGGVEIHFPAFDDLPAKNFYWGTREFESASGDEYKSVLSAMPNVRSRSGSAQDYAEFAVNDPESFWYDTIKPYEDVFEDSKIICREFLKTEDDVFEAEITLEGYLEKFSINESDLSLSFSGISDMSRTGKPVGGRILSQRFCAANFNKNGLLSPLIDPCGWQLSQGGNPVYCTHKRTGPDGCEDHNNAHRIVAVEGLTSAQIQYVTTGGIGGGGWTYGDGNVNQCFVRNTLVWMADGNYKRIYLVEKDDSVMSFDPSGNLVARKVLETFSHQSDEYIVADFGRNRTVAVKPAHFFLIGTDLFLPVGDVEVGKTVRARNEKDWFDLVLRRSVPKQRMREFFNFRVEDTATYFIVLSDGTKIGVHNAKINNGVYYPEVMV